MLALSIFQALLIVGLIFIKITGSGIELYNSVFIAACLSTTILLFLGYPVFKDLSSRLKTQNLAIQSQLFLHFVIFIFIVFDHIYGLNYTTMLGFSPLLIAFFLTAVITWRCCYSLLKSKIYKIFTTGSTALLIWTTVLTLLGLFYQERFLTENLHTLLLVYFAVHFAELGFVLIKINHDLKSI